MTKYSFDPIISHEPTVLILGSLPGDLSIEKQQYYAHPRNRFWKMLFEIFEEDWSEEYHDRVNVIQKHHLVLWDVANSAQRKGSLDVDIWDEIPNAIEELLIQYPTIHRIIFNGKKAEKLFDKHFERKNHLHYFSLPSTSPANARYSNEKLMLHWKNALHQEL